MSHYSSRDRNLQFRKCRIISGRCIPFGQSKEYGTLSQELYIGYNADDRDPMHAKRRGLMDRWLQLVLLMPEDEFVTYKVLAEELGVSVRTVYDDITRLNQMARRAGGRSGARPLPQLSGFA